MMVRQGATEMLLLNFSHPLADQAVQQIAAIIKLQVTEVQDVLVHFDHGQPFAAQIEALVEACGLTPKEWQTTPLMIIPPALNVIAVTLLAELHGRMGYFPPVVRLRPVAGSTPTRYEVAEIINLQQVRNEARGRR